MKISLIKQGFLAMCGPMARTGTAVRQQHRAATHIPTRAGQEYVLPATVAARTAFVGLYRPSLAGRRTAGSPGHGTDAAREPRRVQCHLAEEAGRLPEEHRPTAHGESEAALRTAHRGNAPTGLVHRHPNMADVLTAPSGSRRFIGMQVTADINLRQTANYEQLYAQALEEQDNHERYWFDEQDNVLVMQHNQRFQQRTSEEEFFHEYLAASPDENTGEWMTATSIITYIKSRARSSFRPPTSQRMGRVLKNLPGMIHKHTMQGEQYLVVKR